MAPYVAESARSTQSNANRPTPVVPRIVPAVPLAFSRAQASQRPITPEENGPDPALTRSDEQEPKAEETVSDEHEVAGVNAPLTPESKISGSVNQENDDTPPEESSADVFEPVHEQEETPGQYSVTNVQPTLTDEPEPEASSHHEPSPRPLSAQPTNGTIKELPPPFYPADHTSTPTSATSSTLPPFQLPHNNIPMHHPRPSANSIVFGGMADSSSNSPAPPAGMMGYPPPPPPGFVPANYTLPPFFAPTGHSHHHTEPTNAHMGYPSIAPLAPPPGYRRNMSASAQPWYPPGVQASYSGPPVESFSPQFDGGYLNGGIHASRSPSQASTHTQDGDFRQRAERNGDRALPTLQNGSHVPATVTNDSAHELASYLLSQFGNQKFADHVLQVEHPNHGVHLSLPLHSMLAARSPVLLRHLEAQKESSTDEDGLKVVNVVSHDRYINNFSLTEAIKYLYGMPLPTPSLILQGLQSFDLGTDSIDAFTEARVRMDQSLSYIAAGYVLSLPNVCHRGTGIAKALLRWDTIESAVSFSLDGGLAPIFANESDPPADGVTGKKSFPTYEPYSTSLLLGVVEFIAYNFPAPFSLDTTAPQLPESPLLPTYVESRAPTHNPRLSKIRFGQVPVEESPRPSFVTTLLSTILLSVPFPVLQHILAHYNLGTRLGWPKVAEVMQAVVEGRENRRKKALKNQAKATGHREADDHLVDNLSWEEYIESSAQHPSGQFIGRRRVSNVTASPGDAS